MFVKAPIIALYADLTTSVPIFCCWWYIPWCRVHRSSSVKSYNYYIMEVGEIPIFPVSRVYVLEGESH